MTFCTQAFRTMFLTLPWSDRNGKKSPGKYAPASCTKQFSFGILVSVKTERKVTIQLKRPWLLALLAIPFLLQLVIPNRAWIAIFISLGGSLGLSYLWARQLAEQTSVARQQYYGWAHVGDLLEERFTLRNDSFFPILWLEIDDRSDLPGYTARSVRSAEGKQTIQWRTEGICRQRGLFTLGPWKAQMSDPLGFFQVTLDFPEKQSILIYPPVVHLPTIRLPRGAATGTGRTSRRALEVTTNAVGVRAYAPGDSLNRIHWRSTARTNSFMVKTFDLEPSGDLWIVLDLDASVQAGEGEESTEEYGVILASSLADRVLRQNRAVGLVAYGSSGLQDEPHPTPLPIMVQPQRGQAQRWRILHALATVRAGGRWPLERALAEMDRNLGRGMTLVVITPACTSAWVANLLPPMRRGVAPTVLLLDPSSFGGPGNPDALIGLLADWGIPTHPIAKGMPFKPIVEHERSGRPEYKVLLGTGRVIAVRS
jgi:uncharacterized protein (DUF58 family)